MSNPVTPEPVTEAGRDALSFLDRPYSPSPAWRASILAIEREAAALALREARKAVGGLAELTYGFDWPKGEPMKAYPLTFVDRAAVLAILTASGTEQGEERK